jgi:hypothetical protein
MAEMRQLLRYEIPSLLIFLDISLIILCFVDLSKFVAGLESVQVQAFYLDIFKALPGISIILVLIALPFGWLLYQIYDALYLPHYKKRSIELLCGLMKDRPLPKGNRADMESNLEELIDALLYNDENDNKSILYGLKGYWDQHDARYIIGYYVPVISIVFGVYCLMFLYVNYSFIVSPLSSIFRFVNFLILVAFNFLFLPCFVFNSHKRILDEIDARECFFIYIKEPKIKEFCDDINLDKYFIRNEIKKENIYNQICNKIANFLKCLFS